MVQDDLSEVKTCEGDGVMGMFVCCECGRYADSHDGCDECGTHKLGLVCRDCLDNLYDNEETLS